MRFLFHGPGRDEKEGNVLVGFPDVADQGKPVLFRKHDIDQTDIETAPPEGFQGGFTIHAPDDGKPLETEGFLENHTQVRVILYQENPGPVSFLERAFMTTSRREERP